MEPSSTPFELPTPRRVPVPLPPRAETGLSVPGLVAAQALRRPGALALSEGARAITFAELDARAERLAARLAARGAGPEVPVGVCLERSIELAIAWLAAGKAGAAYLPLDPGAPADRLAFMLRDSGAPVLVGDSRRDFPAGPWSFVSAGAEEPAGPAPVPLPPASPESLAYVIYTSGSTGEPKGVQVEHRNLSHLVAWHRRAFALTEADRTTLIANPAFDAATWELWPSLAAGASVHIPGDDTRVSPEALRDWLIARKITVSFVPTAIAETLLALEWPRQAPLRLLLTGGDALHVRPRPGMPFRLVNNYGPTEATVVATSGEVEPGETAAGLPSIGKPIDRVEAIVLDEDGRPVADGEAGELHLGGAGLARGYLRRPRETAAKFIPHPGRPGRLYRTGDRVRRRGGGELEFLGRVDDQIKIRGHRIEPAEIEAALERHPAVVSSLAMGREDVAGEKTLVAYVVLARAESDDALRAHLAAALPEYMIPSAFVRLEAFPRTRHGKFDRARLPAPPPPEISGRPAESPVERRVAEIAALLLRRERVGADENFFAIGGHSLLGTQMIARLRDAFGIELPLRSVFERPTVARLSAEIERLVRRRIEEMSEDEAERLSSAGRSAERA